MNAVTHLEKVITGEVSAVTHLEKVIAGETSAVTYTEKVITGEATPITHLQKVIAGVESPVTHLEYIWAGRTPEPTEHEYTGAVPVTFNADGEPLLDYLISGNMQQTGTPTLDNPIQPSECGERTRNVLDYTTVENSSTATATQISGGISVSGQFYVQFKTVKCTVGSSYTMSWTAKTVSGTVTTTWRFRYSDNTYSSMPSSGRSLVAEKEVAALLLYVNTSSTASGVAELTNIMLNTGSTALPYENFGYIIPISSANTTTPVYLGEVETTRKIGKLVLTGNEAWTFTTSGSNNRAFLTDWRGALGNSLLLCTHYEGVGDGGSYPSEGKCIINVNGTPIFNANFVADKTEWIAYIQQQYSAGTPVTVWYVLAEPTTGIVNEPIRKIGNYADTLSMEQAGVSIPTNNGSTTVDVDTTLKPSEVYIKYKGV